MAEQRNNNRWNWEVSGFEPRKLSSSSSTASSFDHDDYKPGAPLVRRRSATTFLFGQLAREDYLELRQEASSSIVEYPDDYNIRVNTGDDALSNPKKDFKLDRVYGPHVGQAELFSDVQPLVQSALDGYNVSIFAYGQTNSGKTHTMVALFSSFPPSAFVCVCLCRNVYLMYINLYLYADFYSSSQFKAL
ncbi:hypothetical protein ACE6H2_020927 [Prunus campanulata]